MFDVVRQVGWSCAEAPNQDRLIRLPYRESTGGEVETKRADSNSPPLPPTSASVERGRLKDTPANRALRPEQTPEELFTNPLKAQRAKQITRRVRQVSPSARSGLR